MATIEWTERDAKLSEITVDPSYQMRADPVDTDDYEVLIRKDKKTWPFPPLKCVQVDKDLLLVEGFTRWEAAQSAGRKTVPVVVLEGTREDAIREACGANAEHGFRRTQADKVKAMESAYAEITTSPTKIAQVCKVSRTTATIFCNGKKGTGKQSHNPTKPTKPKAKDSPQGAQNAPESTKEPSEAPNPPGLDYGACAVCGADQWEETDGGVECVVCKHDPTEAPGTEEGKEDAEPVSPEDQVGAELVECQKRFQALQRQLDRCGLAEQAGAWMGKIHKAIVDRKKLVS